MIEKIYSEEFNEKVLGSAKPVVVDFFADWCGPCKMLAPALDELSAQNADFDFYKINIDENPELANKYQIVSIPFVGIFKGGVMADKSIGFLDAEALQDFLNANK